MLRYLQSLTYLFKNSVYSQKKEIKKMNPLVRVLIEYVFFLMMMMI